MFYILHELMGEEMAQTAQTVQVQTQRMGKRESLIHSKSGFALLIAALIMITVISVGIAVSIGQVRIPACGVISYSSVQINGISVGGNTH